EEAAAQGLIAGINAACKVLGKKPFYLKRSEAYIAVMIDDLITKEHTEPYRMFTSRAEHRLLLRQDNADLRLREYAYELGMISDEQYKRLQEKKRIMQEEKERLSKKFVNGSSLGQHLCRPECTYNSLLKDYPELVKDYGDDINIQIEMEFKYAGYIQRQEREVAKLENVDAILVPKDFDYKAVKGLKKEAQDKLMRFQPENLGIASRIPGVTFSDISIVRIHLVKKQKS
ncbi:MAG TPA: tRNA uridine-5-carboxymethylaminomethyl(34) synthesis enzyme MnmG, partial [Chlamydiales bacterium]|nr:tRNA uridine-5-carboxymethylaminomethyl(34) synthesis enzyme MnmG [Chlamydiales bacterium]